jgi:biotin carboxylase
MTGRNVICLGAGPNQLPLIHAAHQLGFRVTAIDRNPLSPGMAVADATIVASTHDAEAVIAALGEGGTSYQGLLARTCGPPLLTAARISEAFGFNGISAELAELTIRKSSLRDFAACHAIAMPRGWRSDLAPEAYGFPLIVKPDLTVAGKRDIFLVRDREAFERAVAAAKCSSGNGLAEIEEFVDGCDVTWVTLLDRGSNFPLFALDELVGITPTGEIRGVGIATPSISAGTACEALMLAQMERFAALFPGVRAILAFSFRIDRLLLRPVIIEIHADLTGDLILDVLMPQAYPGADVLCQVVQVALGGEPFQLAPEAAQPTLVRYTGSGHEIIQRKTVTENLERVKEQAGELAFLHLEMAGTL